MSSDPYVHIVGRCYFSKLYILSTSNSMKPFLLLLSLLFVLAGCGSGSDSSSQSTITAAAPAPDIKVEFTLAANAGPFEWGPFSAVEGSPLTVGTNIVLTAKVTNVGNATAENVAVKLSDALALFTNEQITHSCVSLNSTAQCPADTRPLQMTIPFMQAGSLLTFTFNGRVRSIPSDSNGQAVVGLNFSYPAATGFKDVAANTIIPLSQSEHELCVEELKPDVV